MPIVTTGLIGTNLTDTPLGTGTSANQGNDFALGTKVNTSDGGTYMFVHAAAAITQYDCVAVDENFEATPITSQLAQEGHTVGFAQVAFAANDFGWVGLNGTNGMKVRIAANCAKDEPLYTTDTAGVLDEASVSQKKIQGVVAVASTTTSLEAMSIIATWPTSVPT